MSKKYNLNKYHLPLKKDFPYLQYDLSLIYRAFLNENLHYFPPYLKNFKEKVVSYANANITKPELDNKLRIYILDNRLEVLMILLDDTGDIADWSCQFAKYSHDYDDYIFGECDEITGPSLAMSQNKQQALIQDFIDEYTFCPVESFALATFAILQNDKIKDLRLISLMQVSHFLMKYADKNLVDWNTIISNPHFEY